jgi:hypothetical protein
VLKVCQGPRLDILRVPECCVKMRKAVGLVKTNAGSQYHIQPATSSEVIIAFLL